MKNVFCPVGHSPEQSGAVFFDAAESAVMDRQFLQYGSARVWFPAETAMIRGLGGLKNRKMN